MCVCVCVNERRADVVGFCPENETVSLRVSPDARRETRLVSTSARGRAADRRWTARRASAHSVYCQSACQTAENRPAIERPCGRDTLNTYTTMP